MQLGGSTTGGHPHPGQRFATTHWSVVLAAREECSPQANGGSLSMNLRLRQAPSARHLCRSAMRKIESSAGATSSQTMPLLRSLGFVLGSGLQMYRAYGAACSNTGFAQVPKIGHHARSSRERPVSV